MEWGKIEPWKFREISHTTGEGGLRGDGLAIMSPDILAGSPGDKTVVVVHRSIAAAVS